MPNVEQKGFSALQRAENSSIIQSASFSGAALSVSVLFSEPKIPQYAQTTVRFVIESVSVLFSEPKIPQSNRNAVRREENEVSVLFSEPKIPQYEFVQCQHRRVYVSVLFSEPKIPQSVLEAERLRCALRFSALQRAENSSIVRNQQRRIKLCAVSVLFSEPKIPQ